MHQRVFITGVGIITAIGRSPAETLNEFASHRSGLGELSILNSTRRNQIPCCEVKVTDTDLAAICKIATPDGFTRTTLLGLFAAREALKDASISIGDKQYHDTGIIGANTIGGMSTIESIYTRLLDVNDHGDFMQYAECMDSGESTERIADELGINSFVTTISSACSSSANAILYGARLIRNGKFRRMLCGGSDALSKLTINGFDSLKILDHAPCRPFDETRFGLNLGEGAAYLVLESEDALMESGKNPLAEVRGWSNTNDAYHQTASSPDGAGAFRSMQQALLLGKVDASEVSYINAHGTGTPNNDLSEGIAIQQLFNSKPPPFSSTKSFTGHTLGAAGAVEAVFSVMAIHHKCLFPNLNFSQQMNELQISPVTQFAANVEVKHVLSNSFGFGGNNTTLLISKPGS